MTPLAIPRAEEPLVSAVIVAHGGWRWLRRALEALIENTTVPFEVVVVDNASPDETATRLREEVRGATLLLNDRNLGFPSGINQGVAVSRGRYVCLLNSDTIVQPRWLEPLIETLTTDSTVGAAVPMFLNADGTLQEAGSVVDAEGWALAIGADDDPRRFEHRFRRDVDFGSAACLLIERATFDAAGGLDPAYDPGYYEDVDLAFRLNASGLRIVYQPRARIVHVRFGSGSMAVATALVRRNRDIFFERWQARLSSRPRLVDLYRRPGRILRARDLEVVERVLVVCDEVPAVGTELHAVVGHVAATWPRGRLTVAATTAGEAEQRAPALLDAGIEVAAGESDWAEWLRRRRYHYFAVLIGDVDAGRMLSEPLRATQPQAAQVVLEYGGRMPGAGSDQRIDAAVRLDGGTDVRQALITTLAAVGLAPPRAEASATEPRS